MAQGAVLCIADGHLAVETPHGKPGCVAIQKNSHPAPLGSTLENSTTRNCLDMPIFGVGSHLTIPSSAELSPPAFQPIVIFSLPPVVLPHTGALHSQGTTIALRFIHASLRSTVLLI